jgi:hypothetical protein
LSASGRDVRAARADVRCDRRSLDAGSGDVSDDGGVPVHVHVNDHGSDHVDDHVERAARVTIAPVHHS